MPNFEVSIDQDKCTSCGLCPEITGRYFFMGSNSFAYVKEESVQDPESPTFAGFSGKVAVSSAYESSVIDAATECPGECIYIELTPTAALR
jgi:ferredoxin